MKTMKKRQKKFVERTQAFKKKLEKKSFKRSLESIRLSENPESVTKDEYILYTKAKKYIKDNKSTFNLRLQNDKREV